MFMKTLVARALLNGALLGLVVLLAGCATARVDWRSRLGTYTFDQAVLELGPPDKQAKLSDNPLVAEWLTRRGYSHAQTTLGYGYYPYYYYGPFLPTYIESYSPDYFLRLTFGADGKLKAWKKFAR